MGTKISSSKVHTYSNSTHFWVDNNYHDTLLQEEIIPSGAPT